MTHARYFSNMIHIIKNFAADTKLFTYDMEYSFWEIPAYFLSAFHERCLCVCVICLLHLCLCFVYYYNLISYYFLCNSNTIGKGIFIVSYNGLVCNFGLTDKISFATIQPSSSDCKTGNNYLFSHFRFVYCGF